MPHALQKLVAHLPDLAQACLLAGLFIGLALWLLGRRMARLTCATLGLVTGLSVGIAIAAAAGRNELAMVAMVCTSFAGLFLAWKLFRLWMSLGLAFVLAAVAPASLLIWQGGLDRVVAPAAAPSQEEQSDELSASSAVWDLSRPIDDLVLAEGVHTPGEVVEIRDPRDLGMTLADASSLRDEDGVLASLHGTPMGIALAAAAPAGARLPVNPYAAQVKNPVRLTGQGFETDTLADAVDAAKAAAAGKAAMPAGAGAFAQRQAQALRQAWEKLTPSFRQVAAGLAGAGAVTGLVVGLLWPGLAAALQSSLMGSVIIVLAGGRLLLGVAPAYLTRWESSPRGILLAVGLITALGVLLQCTIIRRQADR